jgi:hypothetical protein
MKTTIELAKECGFNIDGEVISVAPSQYYSISNGDIRKKLEAFRLAVEADFVSRCECVAWINRDLNYTEISTKSTVYGSHTIPLYTLPKETK